MGQPYGCPMHAALSSTRVAQMGRADGQCLAQRTNPDIHVRGDDARAAYSL